MRDLQYWTYAVVVQKLKFLNNSIEPTEYIKAFTKLQVLGKDRGCPEILAAEQLYPGGTRTVSLDTGKPGMYSGGRY
jgi:hypothetical protein